jgi:hypothetical protein
MMMVMIIQREYIPNCSLELIKDKKQTQFRSGISARQTHAYSTRSQGIKRRERKFSVKRRPWNND